MDAKLTLKLEIKLRCKFCQFFKGTLQKTVHFTVRKEFHRLKCNIQVEDMHTGILQKERENMKERSEWRIEQLQLAYKVNI